MAEELTRDLVEDLADASVSKFIDGYAKKAGRLSFDMQTGGYNYHVTYQLNSEGFWRMLHYTPSLL